MKKITRKLTAILAGVLTVGLLAACTETAEEKETGAQPQESGTEVLAEAMSPGAQEHPEIRYRRMPTATSDLFEAGIIPILEAQGYTFIPVEITDSIQREIALSEDEIDMHIDAHTAYIESFNENQGTALSPVLPVPTVPTGIYSGTRDHLDDLAEGDKIAFPNDASNEARALNLLSKIGFISLDESVEPTRHTIADITENPYNLEFIEMDGGTIAGVRTDFAFIILRGSDAYNAGIDFDTALAAETQEDILADNIMQLVVNGVHSGEDWVQDVIAAYRSEEFKEYMKTESAFWILPDYLQ